MDNVNTNQSLPTSVPDYIREQNGWQRNKINSEVNFSDTQSNIFEIICEVARDHSKRNEYIVSFETAWNKVLIFGQKNLIREIHSEINAKANTKEVLVRLNKLHYINIHTGSPENPESFYFTQPGSSNVQSKESSEAALLKDKIKSLLLENIGNLKNSHKVFLASNRVMQFLKSKYPNMTINKEVMDQITITAMGNQITQEFVNSNSQQKNILAVTFQDKSAILLPTDYLTSLLNDILPNRIKNNFRVDASLMEKMKFAYSKKSREMPSIDSVFTSEITDASFEWISIYYEIVKETNMNLQMKKSSFSYQFLYQSASLLYHFFLSKRESQLENKALEKQRINDCRLLEKQMVKEYEQPWDPQKILDFLNSNTTLEKKYTKEDLQLVVSKINEVATRSNRIPNIINFTMGQSSLYLHKYRFILFFFKQLNIESLRLKNYYIEKWSQSVNAIPAGEKQFEADIQQNVGKFFTILLKEVIPYIFQYKNPFEHLTPAELMNKDKATWQKYKNDFELLVKSVFLKGSLTLQPLHQLLALNLDEIKKTVLNERGKYRPTHEKLFGWFFRLLKGLFMGGALKEEMRMAVSKAEKDENSFSALNDLIRIYKSKPDVSTGQLNYLRRQINKSKARLREINRDKKKQQKKEEQDQKNLQQMKVMTAKECFLKGRSIEEMLEEYSNRCFLKIDDAKKDSEESIRGAINTFFRRYHIKIVCDVEAIKGYAKNIVKHNESIFGGIRDKEALRCFIELLILRAFLKKY